MLRRTLIIASFLIAGIISNYPAMAQAYNYGDYRSATLITKAWKALEAKDIGAVLAYTNKCIELYAGEAVKMQKSLAATPEGSDKEIFAYWALNDVATGLYIQGEVYRKANMPQKARAAYQKLIDEYRFGQCWDTRGFFWKPAETAKGKLAMMASGVDLDFGDYSSSTLAGKAWKALADKNLDAVMAYTDKCLELYEEQARQMQKSLTEYPWESKEKIFSYWALNDVGTCLFIKGDAFNNAGKTGEAKKTFKKLVNEYYYAQCWDPNGWFWKPSEAAQQKLAELKK